MSDNHLLHTDQSSHKHPWLPWVAAGTLAASLVALLFLPLLRAFPEPKVASTHPDALEFIWTTWRLQGVLAGEKQLYYSTDVFAPTGASLLLHTICEGVLIPITALLQPLDPIWRYNVALMVACVLSSWAALSLFKSLGCGALGSIVASTLVVCSPWNMGHIHAGHLNFVALFALLETLRGMIVYSALGTRAREHSELYLPTRSVSDAIRYALAVTLLCFTNLYYLYFAALLIPAFALSATMAPHARSALQRARAAGTVLLPFVVGLVPAALHLTKVALLAHSGLYSPDHNPTKHAADVAALLIPGPVQHLGAHPVAISLRRGVLLHAGESSLYLGVALGAAALTACCVGPNKARRSARLFVIVTLLFGILSLGPVISWRGVALIHNPLDYAARAILPFYPSVPARLAGVASLMLIAAASQLLSRSQTKRMRSCGYALVVVGLLEFLPIPLGAYPLPLPSPTLELLARDTEATIVVDPAASPQYAMLRQTVHGKPLVGGFLSRHPRQAARALNRNRFIRALRGHSIADVDAVRHDWCALSANRLLLELPSAHAHHEYLAALGFALISSDSYVALFAPSADLCTDNASSRL
jgi:hypothetical protein